MFTIWMTNGDISMSTFRDIKFREQTIPNGCIFQIEVINQDKAYLGSLVSHHDVKIYDVIILTC